MNIIELKHVTKKFGDTCLFRDYDMCFEKGKFYAVTGDSGTGKSTLLNMIASLECFDQGDIVYNEVMTLKKGFNQRRYLRDEIAFLFQNYALIEKESVKQNLMVPLNIKKEKDRQKCIGLVLSQVGLSGYENKYINTLSGGEQQRIALARILLKNCNLVLADEPTGNLDEHNKQIVFSILKELQQSGKTIIMVTHDLALASKCDEVIQLRKPDKKSQ